MLFICSFTFIDINVREAYRIKDNKWDFNTKLTYKDKSYFITSDSIIYAGHQENFTFLYGTHIEQPIIFSNTEILKIESIPILNKGKK